MTSINIRHCNHGFEPYKKQNFFMKEKLIILSI